MSQFDLTTEALQENNNTEYVSQYLASYKINAWNYGWMIGIILTDNAIVIWFAILEGLIIFNIVIKWLRRDYCGDQYQKMLS